MNDDWDFYLCQIESKPASMMLDMGIRGQIPMPAFPDMAYLRLYLQTPAASGMTTSEEAEILHPFEDTLGILAKESKAIYVGRVTTDGFRDFVFYAADGAAFESEIASTAATFAGYRFDVGSRPDPEWALYRDYLYPSGRMRQVMKNRGVYEALSKEGDALAASREVEHWAYFPTPYARTAFIQNCLKEGFQARSMLEPEDEAEEFGVTIFRQDVPSPAGLDDVTVMLFDLAEAAGGRYDGWETQIQRAGLAPGRAR